MVLPVLLGVGVALLVIIALIVLLPIHVAFSWQSDPAEPSTVSVRPFGGVFPAIKVYNSVKRSKTTPKALPKRSKARRGGLVPHGDVLAESVALLRRLLLAIHFDNLQLDAEFGLGDPGETGQIYGQLCPLIYATGGHVQVQPNFTDACLRGSARAQLHFSVLGLIWPIISFGWRRFGPFK
jgi:hypothetical protein